MTDYGELGDPRRMEKASRSGCVLATERGSNALKTVGGRFFVPTPWVG